MTTGDVILKAYRRIREAAEKGRGVRLSADEVGAIWYGDQAVQQVIWTAIEEAEDAAEEAPDEQA